METKKILDSDKDIEKLLIAYDENEIYRQFLGKIRYLIEKLIFRYWEIEIGESRDYNRANSDKARRAAVQAGANNHFRELKYFFEKINVFQHDLADNDSAKVAIHSYYSQLVEIRNFVKDDLKIDVLQCLESFYPEKDKTLESFYRAIAQKIADINKFHAIPNSEERYYYVIKEKTFFVNGKHYYETTLNQVLSKSKFDKFIVYSSSKLPNNYGLMMTFHDANISVNGQTVPIKVVGTYRVGIRGCELNRLAKLSNTYQGTVHTSSEYRNLLNFLTSKKLKLIDLIYFGDQEFEKLKELDSDKTNPSHKIFNTLKTIRNIILNNAPGANVFRFLLTFVKKEWINDQISYNEQPNELFNNLPIKSKSYPFDQMPFAFSICGHDIPKHYVYDAIDPCGRRHEIMASLLETAVNQNGILYYPLETLKKQFSDYEELTNRFNSSLTYQNHKENFKIVLTEKYAFINGYETSSFSIIQTLLAMSKIKLKNYEQYVSSLLAIQGSGPENEEKDNILKKCFADSRVFILSGAAGTGKTYFIARMCGLLDKMNPLVLARTNPAVKNLRARPNIKPNRTMTIEQYLHRYEKEIFYSTNLLIIDECSTVSNNDILRILNTIDLNETLVLLAGDEHQIESIDFGNWFSLALKILPDESKSTLKTNYRSSLENHDEENMLQKLWNNALENSEKSRIVEIITENYYKALSSFGFDKETDDEIILCLNYDGFYGINNINRIMQSKNNNPNSVTIGDWRYSVGDPIIFETNWRFWKYIYNDTKGKLLNIEEKENSYIFTLEIEQPYNPMWDLSKPPCFISVERKGDNRTIISFLVTKKIDFEADEQDIISSVIPFRVTYCISIHKAQGLEFKKVKILITDSIQEMISPNIFYTAITRTTKDLEIYGSPASISSICSRMSNEFEDDHDFKEFMRRHYKELFPEKCKKDI